MIAVAVITGVYFVVWALIGLAYENESMHEVWRKSLKRTEYFYR